MVALIKADLRLAEAGIPLALGTDWPVVNPYAQPWHTIDGVGDKGLDFTPLLA